MGSSFLKLTNDLLRRINEVELTETNFSSTRGIQTVAKDCVNDSLREICQQRWEWPFHAVEHSQQLQIGEHEYAWPVDFHSVDWNSFQIRKDDTLNINNRHLKVINRDEWYSFGKDTDENSDPDGMRIPSFVFRSHGNGFGISPSPDKEYTIEFRYYKSPSELVNFGDKTDIPKKFDNVILWGSLYNMNLFRENAQGSSIAQEKFKQGLSNMYSLLINRQAEVMTDTRLNFGNNIGSTFSGKYHI